MLTIDNISKLYSKNRGLLPLSLNIKEGSITAVIGPNGAGKSTFFNILMGIHNSDTGRCLLNDVSITDIPLNKTGFLPEHSFLIEKLTVVQMIDYILVMKNIHVEQEQIDELLTGFNLVDYKDSVVNNLSQGMAKRLSIICATIGFPSLIVLDEPLNALDIQSVIFLKNLLYKAKQHKCHILISSHVLDFLDDLVDRIVFLNKGYVIKDFIYDGSKVEQVYRELYNLN